MPRSSGAVRATTPPPRLRVARATQSPLHTPSHLSLTREFSRRWTIPLPEHAFERFDAVIVPAGRKGLNLRTAAAVARRAAHHLVVFCSRDCTVAEAEQAIADVQLRIPVFVVDASRLISPIPFACDEVLAEAAPWQPDTSLKRNAGLVLARQLGWNSALFLDDDVRDLEPDELRRALTVLRAGQGLLNTRYRVAGWNFPDFPDNSIVCHAYRQTFERAFGEQGTFIGGGGLAVRIDRRVSFFPRTYNEDWLFMYRELVNGSVAHMGSLTQKPFDPFERTSVARRQEFGDLLGEGLFAALHERRRDPGTAGQIKRVDYWAAAADRRSAFIDHVRGHLDVPDPARAQRIKHALDESSAAVSRIKPRTLAKVVQRFDRDLNDWGAHLSGLEIYRREPVQVGMARALEPLNATAVCVVNAPTTRLTIGLPRRRAPRAEVAAAV